MPEIEPEEAFLERHAREQRKLAEEAPCVVGAVHEDLSDEYSDRLAAAKAQTEALEQLTKRIP